jgi:hypothetical protein
MSQGQHDDPDGRLHGLLFLPHERRAAERAWEDYQRKPDTRMRQNYGPKGMALLAAARTDNRFGFGIGLVGLIVYAVYNFTGPGATLSYVLLAVALGQCVLVITRGSQAAAAGRHFRGGRPYVRRA